MVVPSSDSFVIFFFVFYLCSGFRVLLRSGGSEDFLENRGGLIEFWAFSILDGRKEKLMEVEALTSPDSVQRSHFDSKLVRSGGGRKATIPLGF